MSLIKYYNMHNREYLYSFRLPLLIIEHALSCYENVGIFQTGEMKIKVRLKDH